MIFAVVAIQHQCVTDRQTDREESAVTTLRSACIGMLSR